jgi:hypothetical protein
MNISMHVIFSNRKQSKQDQHVANQSKQLAVANDFHNP